MSRRAMAAVMLATMLSASCGYSGRADDGPVSVGEGLVPDTTPARGDSGQVADSSTTGSPDPAPSTTGLSPPPTAASRDARTPVTGRQDVPTSVANRSIVDHPGWRVMLTVGDRGEFATTDTIPIEVVLTNASGDVAYHEVDQPDSVVITRADDPERRAWSHIECNPTLGVYKVPGGLRAVEPAEDVPMVVRYPMSEQCRLPAGEYLAFGQWSVCPTDARVETPNPGTYRCQDGMAYLVDAGPVSFRLR